MDAKIILFLIIVILSLDYLLNSVLSYLNYKSLSKREFEVFEYLASGLSSKSIAKKISVTLPTVKFHLKNIYRKLDLKGRKGVLELYSRCIQ